MVYKKYIVKRGRMYGPYLYENKRVGNKVLTTYVGRIDKNERNYFLYALIILGLFISTTILILLFVVQPTGRVALDLKTSYNRGELIKGDLKFNLASGELMPKESKISISYAEKEKDFGVGDLINASTVSGRFYAEGIELEGSGEGYGIAGIKENFPEIDFELIVSEKESGKSRDEEPAGEGGGEEGETPVIITPDTGKIEGNKSEEVPKGEGMESKGNIEGPGKEEPEKEGAEGASKDEGAKEEPGIEKGEGDKEEEKGKGEESNVKKDKGESKSEGSKGDNQEGSEQSGLGESVSPAESSGAGSPGESLSSSSGSEPSPGPSGPPSSESQASESSPAPVTGAAVGEEEHKVSGKASKDKEFRYNLVDGESAGIIPGSVRYNGSTIGDDRVKVEIKGNEVIVSTEYSINEEGFGAGYINKNKEGMQIIIPFDKLNITADKSSKIKVTLSYQGKEIVSAEKEINVEGEEGNESIANETDSLIVRNESNATISLNESFTNESLVNESIVNASTDQNQSNITIITLRHKIEAGEPVKWNKNVSLREPIEIDVELPKEAQNISVKKIDERSGEEKKAIVRVQGITGNVVSGKITAEINLERKGLFEWIKGLLGRITGRAISDINVTPVLLGNQSNIIVTLADSATNYIIDYYTESPKIYERNITGGKILVVSGPDWLNYTNVIASTRTISKLSVSSAGRTKIYWRNYNYTSPIELKKVGEVEDVEVVKEEKQERNEERKEDKAEEKEDKAEEKEDKAENNEGIIGGGNASGDNESFELPAITGSLITGKAVSDEGKNNGKDEEKRDDKNNNGNGKPEINNSIINQTASNESEKINNDNEELSGEGRNVADGEANNESISEEVNKSRDIGNGNAPEKKAEKQVLIDEEGRPYQKEEIAFDYMDYDNDSLIDTIQWVVPHLSNQTFEIIEVVKAEHLDKQRNFIADVYEYVRARDGNWTEIPDKDYLRVVFARNLTRGKDVTIYAKSNESSSIDVYEKDSNQKIAEFKNVFEDRKYQILLDGWDGNQDTFDLRVKGGKDSSIWFDYVVDPTGVIDCSQLNVAGTDYQQSNDIVPVTGASCINITAVNITFDGNGYDIVNYTYNGTGINIYANNVTVKNANITAGNRSRSFGIYMERVNDSVIWNNTIAGRIGIIFGNSTRNNITANYINVSVGGYSNNWGIYVNTRAQNNSIVGNVIGTGGTHATGSNANYGIYLATNVRRNNITHNYINTSGITGNYGIVFYDSATNNNVSNNVINTSGTSDNYGIYLTTWSDNNTITANTIGTGGSSNKNYGIYIQVDSRFNNISNNYVNTSGTNNNYAIYLITDATNNNVSNNVINTSGTSNNYGIYLNTRSDNNTVTANTIRTGGSLNNNYGIYIQSQSRFNNITHNYINTSGTANSYGIYLITQATNNNISNNIINTSGSGASNHGLHIDTSDNNTLTGNNIISGGNTNDNDGIYITLSKFNNVTHNSINTSGTSDNDGISVSDATNNNVSNNVINVSGSSFIYGIFLGTRGDNNTISSNVINVGASGSPTAGIYSSGVVMYNNITHNYVNVSGTTQAQGIYLFSGASKNNVSFNNIRTSGTSGLVHYGIYIAQSANNTFESNIINASLGSSVIRIEFTSSDNNNFTNNTIVTPTTQFDLDINQGGINGTWIIDQVIRNYTIKEYGGLIYFKNSTSGLMGQIVFLENINGSGEMLFGNASAAVRILNNSAFVNDTIGGTGLNRTANVTLFGIGITSPVIMKGGVQCTQAMGCYNFSVGQATSSFNVTGWSNYSIAEDPAAINGCKVVSSSGNYRLSGNMASTGTCLQIEASNVLINGQNYSISYGTTGNGIGISVNSSSRLLNVSIIDVHINKTTGDGGNNWGIYYYNVGNGTINNARISTNGTSSNYGIYFSSSTMGLNVSNNYINTSGTGGSNFGIALSTAKEHNISNNVVNVSGTSGNNGVYLGSTSTNNLFTANLIFTGGSADSNYGFYVLSSNTNNFTHNYINTSGTTNNYGLYFKTTGLHNVSNNYINTSGTGGSNHGIYGDVGAASITFIANNILAGGTGSGNYGINIRNDNTVSYNSINTTGGLGNYGIYIAGTTGYGNRISNNNINTSGTGSNHGIYMTAGPYGNVISNNFIIAGGSININNGIRFSTDVYNNNVTGNTIYTSGTSANYGFVSTTRTYSNNISNNYINTSGTTTNHGIYLITGSNNNSVVANIIYAGGSSNTNYGIYLSSTVLLNNITHNYINTSGTSDNYGIHLATDATNNNISFNIIQTGGSTLTSLTNYGIRIRQSSNNTFSSNIINNSHGSAIYMDTNYANNNNFTNNSIVSNTSWFDLEVNNGGINGTWFVDQVIRNYTIKEYGGLIYFKNSTSGLMGQIVFLENINGSGEMLFGNASAAVRILNNSAFVNDTIGGTGLNRTANVTLFGIKQGQVSYEILKGGVTCTQAMGCYNFSVGQATSSFNVTGWSNYSIGSQNAVTDCAELSTAGDSYKQTANIIPVTGASCINITANGVTFNGNGYSIKNDTYNASGVYVLGVDNVTIKNTNLTVGNVTGVSYGIFLLGANDSKVLNNTIQGGRGIYLEKSSRGNVTGNYINTSGADALNAGIWLNTTSDNVSVSWNVISTGGPGGSNYGIYLWQNNTGINVTHNYINTSGGGSDFGITSDRGVFKSNFSNNVINASGLSSNNGIYLQTVTNSNSSDNTITANSITTGGSGPSGRNYGIQINRLYRSNVTHNYINTTGTIRSFGIFMNLGNEGDNVSHNIINASANGATLTIGIYVSNSGNSTIASNVIATGGPSAANSGIRLDGDSNNVTYNYINTSGVSKNIGIYSSAASGSNNNISFNIIKSSGMSNETPDNDGITIANTGRNNTIYSNIINSSWGRGIFIQNAFNTTLVNNTFIADNSMFDVVLHSANSTFIIDQVIRNYSINESNFGIVFINRTVTSMGMINFLEMINGSGEMLFGNASAAVRILNNSAFVNDTIGGTGLNRTANVTLFGIGITIPVIMKGGVQCTQAMGCYNFSVGQATSSFNVTGWSNYSVGEGNTAPGNPTVRINSSDGSNRTLQDLWCYASITDPDVNNYMNVTVQWHNNSALVISHDYNLSYANNTAFNATLLNMNTTKYENWTCGLRVFDSSAYSAWTNTTINVSVLNSVPNVTLLGPVHGKATTNRTTEFNWSANDDDSDGIMVEFRLNSYNYTANNAGCSENITRNFTGTTIKFVPSTHLKCLYDSGFYYNWSIRANDTTLNYGNWGNETRNATIVNVTAVVDVSLSISSVTFQNQSFFYNPSNQTNQTTHSPDPFIIQNDGNALMNLSISSSNLWLRIANPNQYYRFKANNNTLENGSFDWGRSVTVFTNMPFVDTDFLVDLNYTNESMDSAAIDIYVEGPDDEPAGERNSTVTFVSRLTE